MKLQHYRILILAPHTDDGEIGCGGSIAKFVEEGHDIYYVAFSPAPVPVGFSKDAPIDEVKKATQILGIKSSNTIIFNYALRKFNLYRQDILDNLIKLKNEMQPDLVFIPSPNDLHQDHHTIAMEGLRAFKQSTILAYEMPWNVISFNTLAFILLEERHILKKIEAIRCYHSQSHRRYINEDFIRAWARTRGVQIGAQFAETFEVLRWIIS